MLMVCLSEAAFCETDGHMAYIIFLPYAMECIRICMLIYWLRFPLEHLGTIPTGVDMLVTVPI